MLGEHFDAVMISVGDLLKKEMVKKTVIGQEIEDYIKNFLYVPDSIVSKVLIKYINGFKDDKNLIIEGYPKTIYQAKYLINQSIIPDSLVFLNYDENEVLRNLQKELQEEGEEIFDEEIEDKAIHYQQLYDFHTKQSKEVYREICLEFDNTKKNGIEDLAKLIQYKQMKGYQNPLKFVLIGKKCKEMELFLERFQGCFGVKLIQPLSLIQNEIKEKSTLSHELLYHIENQEKFSSQLIFDLMIKKLNRIDVQINGYVLDLTGLDENFFELIIKKYFDINFVLYFKDDLTNCDFQTPQVERLIYQEGRTLRHLEKEEIKHFFNKCNRYCEIKNGDEMKNKLNEIIFEVTHIKDQFNF